MQIRLLMPSQPPVALRPAAHDAHVAHAVFALTAHTAVRYCVPDAHTPHGVQVREADAAVKFTVATQLMHGVLPAVGFAVPAGQAGYDVPEL